MPIKESENDFLSWVIDLAHVRKWAIAHFRPAMVVKNDEITYRTAVSGDGKGFPDCVLARGNRLIFAELKSDKGKLSPEQDMWLKLLSESKAEVYVWKPSDRETIEGILE